jgi:hypothetical protein
MAIAYQGFAIEENLSEAVNDRAILNNLGGSPIGDDISLLFNNTRNFSQLVVTVDNVQNGRIIFNGAAAVFSNKNEVQVNSETYYIKDSNGIDRFALSTNENLSDTVAQPPVGTYTRSDEITADNVLNFSRIKRSTNVNAVEGDTGGSQTGVNLSNDFTSQPIKTQIETIESNVDRFNFKSSQSIAINKDFLSSRTLESTGATIIRDLDGANNVGLSNTSPGLFIYNPNTGSGIRAFSSSDNPWSLSGSDLIVSTSDINIKTLNFKTTNIVLNSKNSAVLAADVSSTAVSTAFTHKVPVTVNGETYFLCLTLEN